MVLRTGLYHDNLLGHNFCNCALTEIEHGLYKPKETNILDTEDKIVLFEIV